MRGWPLWCKLSEFHVGITEGLHESPRAPGISGVSWDHRSFLGLPIACWLGNRRRIWGFSEYSEVAEGPWGCLASLQRPNCCGEIFGAVFGIPSGDLRGLSGAPTRLSGFLGSSESFERVPQCGDPVALWRASGVVPQRLEVPPLWCPAISGHRFSGIAVIVEMVSPQICRVGLHTAANLLHLDHLLWLRRTL